MEIVSHPVNYTPRKAGKRMTSIIREIDGRYSEFNKAGSTVNDLRVSAYKQQALVAAYLLKNKESLSPSQIRKSGGGSKTQQILSGNVYGWFDKVSRGFTALILQGEKLWN